MGENLCQLPIQQELIFRIYRELKKLSPQRVNIPMKKCAHESNRNLKGRGANGQLIHEEVFHLPGYKRDANQNNT
jgi:hypothetical protein